MPLHQSPTKRRWAVHLILSSAFACAISGLAGCKQGTSESEEKEIQVEPGPEPRPAGRRPWLVLLCSVDGAPNPRPHTPEFYQKLFSAPPTPDLRIYDYFQAASYGSVATSAQVYGWFDMPSTAEEIKPERRNNTTIPNRSQTAADCIKASKMKINYLKYSGVITVIDAPVDSGASGPYGKHIVVNSPERSIGFLVHEMLHALGLPDSFTAPGDVNDDHGWSDGPGTRYGDCFDMMSFETCTYTFPVFSSQQGPELQAAWRERLGWMPSNRILRVDLSRTAPTKPSKTSIRLAPVSMKLTDTPGFAGLYQLVMISAPDNGYYTIEFRDKDGFDRAIPAPAVVVRELRADGISYVVNRFNGRIGWNVGEAFTDRANFLKVSVDAFNNHIAQITIDPALPSLSPFVSITPARGLALTGNQVCGNDFRGAVTSCPGGLSCPHGWRCP